MVSPRTLVALTQGISKPCLLKRREDRAGEVRKRQQGDRQQMLEAGCRGDWERWQVCRRYWEGVRRGLGVL